MTSKTGYNAAIDRAVAAAQTQLRDWPEDAVDEDNGQYMNTCYVCGNTFTGHKRRVTCKLCSLAAAQEKVEEAHATIASIQSVLLILKDFKLEQNAHEIIVHELDLLHKGESGGYLINELRSVRNQLAAAINQQPNP